MAAEKEIFRGTDTKFYWRVLASGEIVAVGGQGFATRVDAGSQFDRAAGAFVELGQAPPPPPPPPPPVRRVPLIVANTQDPEVLAMGMPTHQYFSYDEVLDIRPETLAVNIGMRNRAQETVWIAAQIASGSLDKGTNGLIAKLQTLERLKIPHATFGHEPDIKAGFVKKVDYLAAWDHIYDLAAIHAPSVTLAPVHMGVQWEQFPDWLPPKAKVIGVDAYGATNEPTFDKVFASALKIAAGRPIAIYETSFRDAVEGDGKQRTYFESGDAFCRNEANNVVLLALWLGGPPNKFDDRLNNEGKAVVKKMLADDFYKVA